MKRKMRKKEENSSESEGEEGSDFEEVSIFCFFKARVCVDALSN